MQKKQNPELISDKILNEENKLQKTFNISYKIRIQWGNFLPNDNLGKTMYGE